MAEEQVYEDIPSRYKEYIGFPEYYHQLTVEQKLFVNSICQVNEECDNMRKGYEDTVCEAEDLTEELETSLELAKNILSNLKKVSYND